MPEVLTQVDKDESLSGRDLDAAIAERVMGWTNVESGCYTPIGQEWCGDDPEGTGGFNRTGRKIIPRYSERIEAAMEVVEKMRLLGWSFACTLYEGKLPYASFCRGTVKSSRNAEADSLPEAICLAALLATQSQQK